MFVVPDFLYNFIKVFTLIMSIVVFIHLGFYSILGLFGLKKVKRNYDIKAADKSFLIIVPAHNEENVIDNCLESIGQLNYDKNLYKVVTLADNCNDKTAGIVRKRDGVNLFENRSKRGELRGKPHVIGKYLRENKTYWQNFDYIVFLDADNLISENYLLEINSQFLAHTDLTVIQGYLDSKNINESFMSRGYAAAYFITNRAIQYAKHRLGWNTSIGGTGFAIDTNYIKENGWTPRSYTEDFEIQVELSIQGKKSTWNHFAKVYDEKPNDIKTSHVQRTRWSQGHWYIAISKTGQQLGSLFKSKSLIELISKCETLVYSYSMLRSVWLLGLVFLIVIDRRFIESFPYFFSLFWLWLFFEFINYILLPTVYIIQEGESYFEDLSVPQRIKEYLLLWIGYFYSTLLYYFAQIQGFFTWFLPQNHWKKTEHSSAISTDSLNRK
ncbi:glycosyltransferase family 2 protein [Brochothrix thermosphacta]|uniref:glycosyltransferase family 2 protein n=2 Tax=Brochothrix thermosphacta TaxID=2756 RepID=UPI00083FA36C|nr:glycosyltransferase family 2 protein [Brochothrix thermosphacta]ODJ56129.1 hypothetical protein BFR41_04455 [Brochothrix thermosphacta]ODJ71130.1 hypothetical protein BFR43_04530 [Brochothrix thermosphacta]